MIKLKETYERIFGKNSLNEDRDSDYEGQKAMAKKLKNKKIAGYKFEVNSQTDNWGWYNPKTKKEFYATPWETLAATSSGGSGPQNTVEIEAYDEKGDLVRGIPNSARYKHSGNLSRDLANYLKIVKTVIDKLLYGV
jgi:hypothetical protein